MASLKYIELCDTDYSLFNRDLTPEEYDFFKRHLDAYRSMFEGQTIRFWVRYVIIFRSFSVKYGLIKHFPGKSAQFDQVLDEAFIYIHEQFVEGKYSTAKKLIHDIAMVAQYQHCIFNTDGKSIARDPFYMKSSRDVFRTLFGHPSSQDTYFKVSVLIPLFLCFGGSIVECLRRWMSAKNMAVDDDSYWTAPRTLDKKKQSTPRNIPNPANILKPTAGFHNYMSEKLDGNTERPLFVPGWTKGNPRCQDERNPLYNESFTNKEDWRKNMTYEDYEKFLNYCGNSLKLRPDAIPHDDKPAEGSVVDNKELKTESKSQKKRRRKAKKKLEEAVDEKKDNTPGLSEKNTNQSNEANTGSKPGKCPNCSMTRMNQRLMSNEALDRLQEQQKSNNLVSNNNESGRGTRIVVSDKSSAGSSDTSKMPFHCHVVRKSADDKCHSCNAPKVISAGHSHKVNITFKSPVDGKVNPGTKSVTIVRSGQPVNLQKETVKVNVPAKKIIPDACTARAHVIKKTADVIARVHAEPHNDRNISPRTTPTANDVKVKMTQTPKEKKATKDPVLGDPSDVDFSQLTFKPASQKSSNLRKCRHCLKVEPEPKSFKKCQKCKLMGLVNPRYYCGPECQLADWTAFHRAEHKNNSFPD